MEGLQAQLDEARREAARWQRKYRELQRILEKQQKIDHELHMAQSQRAHSAKQMIAVAYREHVELGQELGAVDSELVSVVRTLASTLAGILDRSLDDTEREFEDRADVPAEVVGPATPRAHAQLLPPHASELDAGELMAAGQQASSDVSVRAIGLVEPPAADADYARAESGLQEVQEEEEARSTGRHASADVAPALEEQEEEEEEAVAVEETTTAEEATVEERGASDQREASSREPEDAARAAEEEEPTPAAGRENPPPGDGSLRIAVSSVFLFSGTVPAELPHLELSLDLLGIEGVMCELKRTDDQGVLTCSLDKTVSLQPGSRARARVANALADDNQRASDVRLVLLGSDYESEPIELGSAVLNLESLLEGGRDYDEEAVSLRSREGAEMGTLAVSTWAVSALAEIDRALGEHGSPLAMIEAERPGRAPAHLAVDGSSPRSAAPLTPLVEEESEVGSEPPSRHNSTVGVEPAAARVEARHVDTASRGAKTAVERVDRAEGPQDLLSPELQRLRQRFLDAEVDEWETIALAGSSPRAGMARVETVASPTEVCAPRACRHSRPRARQ
jgi:hypothetical protein